MNVTKQDRTEDPSCPIVLFDHLCFPLQRFSANIPPTIPHPIMIKHLIARKEPCGSSLIPTPDIHETTNNISPDNIPISHPFFAVNLAQAKPPKKLPNARGITASGNIAIGGTSIHVAISASKNSKPILTIAPIQLPYKSGFKKPRKIFPLSEFDFMNITLYQKLRLIKGMMTQYSLCIRYRHHHHRHLRLRARYRKTE